MVLTILLCDGVFSFSLKELSICKGKVCPFSQISMSFLIFSYIIEKKVSWGSSGNKIKYGREISKSRRVEGQHARTL